jgi:nucleoside-diphosphate-sugar epimerase
MPCLGLSWIVHEKNLLIIGLGRVGSHIARHAKPYFHTVIGTKRQPGSSDTKNQIIPFEKAAIQTALTDATHVLITSPPPPNDDTAFWEIINLLRSSNCWLGMISTTGVYGNHDGAWVTEESECYCHTSTSAGRLLQLERYLQTTTCNPAIFRCSGIYGGGKSALHTVYKSGRSASFAREDVLTNRIHVDDIAAAALACMCSNKTGVFNLADELPESRSAVLNFAADLLQGIGVDVPEESSNTDNGSSGRSERRGIDRKLVSNTKMREQILPTLQYPTYKEGLLSILEGRSSPWWQET